MSSVLDRFHVSSLCIESVLTKANRWLLPSCDSKSKFCINRGRAVNIGSGVLQISSANEGHEYGYAGVSTDDQNPALQLAALKNVGCKIVFKDEGLSGATTKRPALLRCLKKLEHGDTLIVWKLDRLGRSLRDLITMLDDLKHGA